MFKTILAPIDLGTPEKLKASIDTATKMAAAWKAKLIVLHVVQRMPGYILVELPDDFRQNVVAQAKAELEKVAKSHKLPAGTAIKVREGVVHHEILAVAEEEGADLILVASHHPEMADYLLGSVAAHVVRHAQCSVLVLRQ